MMLASLKRKQKGFTLIEIMIALMLGLIVIGGAMSIYISTIRGSADITNSARLNYDLDSVMQLMANDIRRAGYWGGAIVDSSAANNPSDCSGPISDDGNPFTCDASNIQTPISTCILYTYDFDENALLDGVEFEFFGFKLDDGQIKVRSSKIPDNTGDCSGAGWQSMVNSNLIEVTYLQFSFESIAEQAAVANSHPLLPALTATTRCLNIRPNPDTSFNTSCDIADNTAGNIATGDLVIEKRVVNIHLSGRVKNDTDVIKSISSSIQIKNARVFNQL